MKRNLIFTALGAMLLASCADTWDRVYENGNPQKEGYEYLAEYAPLKEYVDRSKYPDFKVGLALAAADYNKQELVYALANSNFDEIVAGNAMKMASCVNDKGEMSFTTVSDFVNFAANAGMNVYGHTLAWHSQQPVKWLTSLMKDKELDIDPDAKIETLVTSKTYVDGPFPFYAMGCEPPVINGAIHFVPTGDWSQFFCLPGGENTLTEGDYVMYLDLQSDKDASGIQFTIQNGWGGDAQNITAPISVEAGRHTYQLKFPGVTGGNYDCILKPQTADATLDLYSVTVKQIVKLNSIPLTPEEKKDTLTWAMDKWIGGMMAACDSKVKAWDVVNEAISGGNPDGEGVFALQHSEGYTPGGTWDVGGDAFYWQDYMGDIDYVRTAVALARKHYEANGGTPADLKLFVNDYNLESDWDDNGKVKSLIKWIERWEADGVTKIDGIGTQMHISCYMNPQTQESKKKHITKMFELIAASGKLCRVSELDMGLVDAAGNSVKTADVTEEQHKAMAEMYKFVVSEYLRIIPAAQQWGICQWCATDSPAGSGWRAGEPVGLWDSNYYRKHTYAGFADGLSGK